MNKLMIKGETGSFLLGLLICMPIVCSSIFTLFLSQKIYGDTFYIDLINGDDQNDGLSPSTPLKTLKKAETLTGDHNNKVIIMNDKSLEEDTKKLNTNIMEEPAHNEQISSEIDRIVLGAEVITGWKQFLPGVWQSPLGVLPRRVESNGERLLFGDYFNDISDLRHNQWFWGSGILFLKDLAGNPDETGKKIIAVVKNGGWSVTSGDFNGDGINDILTADNIFDGLAFNTGEVYIYYGNDELSTMPDQTILDPDGKAQDQFGFYVSSAGDVNNDGFDDLIVSIDFGNKVYLFMGSSQGLSDKPDKTLLPSSGFTGYLFGHRIALRHGDINSDGFADILIGGGDDPQYFSLFYGSSLGVNEVPDEVVSFSGTTIKGAVDVSFIGDVNNDGFDDIASNPHKEGSTNSTDVYIFYGSSEGIDKNSSDVITINIGWTHPYGVGIRSAPAGDVNGDGIDDLLVGNQWAFGDFQSEGKAYIFYGSSQGVSQSPDVTIDNPRPGFNQRFGASVDGIGDFNYDGFEDIIIGSSSILNPFIYYGASEGVAKKPSLTFTDVLSDGWSVSHAGDVKGNGQNFIIVGEKFGGAYLYALKRTNLDVVNDYVTFTPIEGTQKVTSDIAGCPEGFKGKFCFDVRLNNSSKRNLTFLEVEIASLTNGNVIHESGAGPGTLLTIPKTGNYEDGVLVAGEFVEFSIEICLKTFEPFLFIGNYSAEKIENK